MILQKLLHNKTALQLGKYMLVSLGGYLFVFSSIFFWIDLCGFSKKTAYIITYLCLYSLNHFFNLRWLFLIKNRLSVLVKYLLHILFFTYLGSLIFPFLASFDVHYFFALAGTIVCLFPAKFLSFKYFVYR